MQIPRNCFVNLVTELLHDTHTSVVRIFMRHKLVVKVLDMFKYFMLIYSPNFRESVARLSPDIHSCECHEPVVSTKFWSMTVKQ